MASHKKQKSVCKTCHDMIDALRVSCLFWRRILGVAFGLSFLEDLAQQLSSGIIIMTDMLMPVAQDWVIIKSRRCRTVSFFQVVLEFAWGG